MDCVERKMEVEVRLWKSMGEKMSTPLIHALSRQFAVYLLSKGMIKNGLVLCMPTL